MITRRDALKHIIVSVGGSALLSACGGRVSLEPLSPLAEPTFYTDREMALLNRVSDLFIPRTETPGALDTHVPRLLDQLFTEWASADTQATHRDALAALDARLNSVGGGDFLQASDDAAEATLTAVDAAAFDGEPLEGYQSLKALISQMYFATEDGALLEQRWVAVPGRWEPCADVTS